MTCPLLTPCIPKHFGKLLSYDLTWFLLFIVCLSCTKKDINQTFRSKRARIRTRSDPYLGRSITIRSPGFQRYPDLYSVHLSLLEGHLFLFSSDRSGVPLVYSLLSE